MIIRRLSLLALFAILLNGCATLSETECVSGNWYQVGYQDGKFGRDSDYILNHESACIEYGVRIDRNQYEQGRQKGLEVYCTGHNGFQHGVKASNANQNCTVAFPEYTASYKDGLFSRHENLQVHLDELMREHEILRQAIRRIEDEKEKERLNLELDDIDEAIRDTNSQISRVNYLLDMYR